MTYGVYLAAKKLKHYFQEHDMRVVAKAPISEIMGNKDVSSWKQRFTIDFLLLEHRSKKELHSFIRNFCNSF